MPPSAKGSYLIIGSGVFGISTAYYLSLKYPEASITVLDRSIEFPCPLAASHDFNKIVRADYGNPFYCKLALEARKLWKTDPLYSSFYHESGMVNVDDTGLGRRILKNYEDLDEHPGASIINPDELKLKFDGLFTDTNYEGVDEIFYNPVSGWAEATAAVKAVVEASTVRGVKFVSANVEQLYFNESGSCAGVKCADGRIMIADSTILSTGAGTAKLLARSASNHPELQSGDRVTAAAVVTGIIRLSLEQRPRFKNSPVFIHSMAGVLGEVLPMTADGLLKFCVDVSFKNSLQDELSRQVISAPPDMTDQNQHKVSETLKEECSRVLKGVFGTELAGSQFDSFRICWDGITPNQDFIISSHPRCQNLYIATGGSFHGWKFLPIIGKYVVSMISGDLEDGLRKRWAWDRDQQGSAHQKIIPKRELCDLV
ncbi:FAD/NAD(P)-binding protein [Glarea lozoyensis ATCC 20868]|uniref:FAD/NAD(P)-binding protein n=1 Tax=Glarea lozoyensis (strain ATCC 20868 / MF5171) TaxID=1116229 RepID=S3DEJ9_GLAL2|nr:FAD/NAD(P)-binding protein [Glarea lozoyensis ATCC 20868]EPE25093.1 FAD/NAD(P)-binding protein [Glarea lozoyensis ATCC 20868]